MKRYLISLQELDVHPENAGRSLTFGAENHDDIFVIVDRLKLGKVVPPAEAEELALGLKLFSEVVLRHRKEPMFADMFVSIGEFIKRLKSEARE